MVVSPAPGYMPGGEFGRERFTPATPCWIGRKCYILAIMKCNKSGFMNIPRIKKREDIFPFYNTRILC